MSGACVSLPTQQCSSGSSQYYLPQTNDLPLPTNMGPPRVTCSGTGTSYCSICAPTGRLNVPCGSAYTSFNISVRCYGNKKSSYASWGASAPSCSFNYTWGAWPNDDITCTVKTTYTSDHGWVRYEWCDDQNNYGSWVTQFQGH